MASNPEPPAPAEAKPGPKDGLGCPGGMKLVTTARFPRRSIRRGRIKGGEAIALARAGKAYCIDYYEYPGKGRTPQTKVDFGTAAGVCKGRGKRLCTDKEWLRACRGRGGASFPYGKSFNPGKCNTEDDEGDERSLAKSGRFKSCRSALGLYDMSGNVAEWTSSKTVRGGDYTSSDEDAACNGGGRRSPGTRRPFIGFRCCSDFVN